MGCAGALAAANAERTDELLGDGDTGSALVWRAIMRAIEELQRERRDGEL